MIVEVSIVLPIIAYLLINAFMAGQMYQEHSDEFTKTGRVIIAVVFLLFGLGLFLVYYLGEVFKAIRKDIKI